MVKNLQERFDEFVIACQCVEYKEKFGGDRFKLLKHSCRSRLIPGAIVEFGVRDGASLMALVSYTQCKRRYFGFDTFRSMPIQSRYKTRYNRQSLPTSVIRRFDRVFLRKLFNGCNAVTLVKGKFSNTLTRKYFKQAALIHMDADIYESTKQALDYCYPFIREGTIIQFDEIFSKKANGKDHEFRAWIEWIDDHRIGWELIGATMNGRASIRVSRR